MFRVTVTGILPFPPLFKFDLPGRRYINPRLRKTAPGCPLRLLIRPDQRFFKERCIPIQMVDLSQKPIAPGEIRRFIDRFGLSALLDVEGKAYVDARLKYLRMPDADLLARIEREPKLLRLPLVRAGKLLSIGQDEAMWKAMVDTIRAVY